MNFSNSVFSSIEHFIPKNAVALAVILFLVSASLSLVTVIINLNFQRTKLRLDINLKNDNENKWSDIVNHIADSPAKEITEKEILQLRRCLGAFKWSEYNDTFQRNNFYAFKDVSIDIVNKVLDNLRGQARQTVSDEESTMLRLIARELVQDRWETYKIYRKQIIHPFLSHFGAIRSIKEKQENERKHAKTELQNYLKKMR